jgi:hypothetical protein
MSALRNARSALPLALFLLLPARTFGFDTSALDAVSFYSPSRVTADDDYGVRVVSLPSLNSGLWSCANCSAPEQPFARNEMEWVLNFSAPTSLAPGAYANMSNAGGVATLPTGAGGLASISGPIALAQCVAVCFNTNSCAAWAWYALSGGATRCALFARGFGTGPQPWPSGGVEFAQGGAVTGAPAAQDSIADGLRSGTWLGGLGTGGYELRADGTFHLSTIRGQSPASEPWHGVVRDALLAGSGDGAAHVARLVPFGGLPGVPELVYSARMPLARLQFLGLALFAYTPLTPGDSNASNTPAVAFTLRATNGGTAPSNITFAVLGGLGLRSDWRGVSAQAAPVPGAASRAACAAACVQAPACLAWQWSEAAGACLADAGARVALGANEAGLDAGNPGAFTAGGGSVVFSARIPGGAQPSNAIGEQGLFAVDASSSDGSGAAALGAAAGASPEALLALLLTESPADSLRAAAAAVAGADAGDLFAMAAASINGLAPGATASLSVVHAWHFPHFFFYRDAFTGSDNGVRYASYLDSAASAAASLNLTQIAANILAWQGVFSGLPDQALSDAAFNLFAHSRSSMWFHERGEEYRQWESLEFTDYLNPTNGDERHLPYFHIAPDAMRSQLRMMVGTYTQN